MCRDELTDTETEHEDDEQAGLKVVRLGGRLVHAEQTGEVEKGARDEQQAPEDAPAFETNQSALLDQTVKLRQPESGQNHHDDQKDRVRDEFIAREKRPDHDGPQNNRSEQPAEKYLRF